MREFRLVLVICVVALGACGDDGAVGDEGEATFAMAGNGNGDGDGDGDGDGQAASGPGVDITDLDCGSGWSSTMITNREVFVDYPCDKPAGTKVTFILVLHGTAAQEQIKGYLRTYWPAHLTVDDNDFIIATPKAVGAQWENPKGGDEAHVLEVIDYMYETFSDFDIHRMWVVGHSWGAFYARTFVCDPIVTDKVDGLISMAGGIGMPACADRLAVIGVVGEKDNTVPGELNQQATATAHGCDPEETYTVGGNVVTDWPNCDSGFVHRNYWLLDKAHGFTPDQWPDSEFAPDMNEAVKSIE